MINPSTFIGVGLGVTIITVGIGFTSEDPSAFLNFSGLLIVLGGVISATMISFPMRELVRVFKVLKIIVSNEKNYVQYDLEEIVDVSRHWYKSDLVNAQSAIKKLRNPYLRSALELVIDGAKAPEIQNFLSWRILKLQAKERAEAQIFLTMATYAPAFGMVGTLIGLINMLQNMDVGNIQALGYHMAIALVTTFYGILLANIIFKPIATKFQRRTEQRVMMMNLIAEAIYMICERKSPAYVRETLRTMMMQYENELFQKIEIKLDGI